MTPATAIQAIDERIDYLMRCNPIDHAAVRRAHADLYAAQLAGPVEARKMLGWHTRMLAEYDAKGDYFSGAEHRRGIEACSVALGLVTTAVAA